MSIKFLVLVGGRFWGLGGGSAEFIFMGARIFLKCFSSQCWALHGLRALDLFFSCRVRPNNWATGSGCSFLSDRHAIGESIFGADKSMLWENRGLSTRQS